MQKEQRKQRKLDEKRKKEEKKRQKKEKKKKRKNMDESDSEVSGESGDDDSSDEWCPPSDLEGQITPYKDEYGSSGNEGRLRKRGRSGDEGGMAVRFLPLRPRVRRARSPQTMCLVLTHPSRLARLARLLAPLAGGPPRRAFRPGHPAQGGLRAQVCTALSRDGALVA